MILTIILSIIFITIDQISKLIITKTLPIKSSVEVIKNLFYLEYAKNNGAAFSILVGKRIFLILVAVIIIIAIIYYLKKNKPKNKLEIIAFSLLLGGSLGNLIDRIVRGYVIDFISVKIFTYNFPIFNLADTFITMGILLIIFTFNRKEDKHES